ncbi:MAG: hypothetical protein IK141_06335 [Clostridia bacterium]|nr:hypothetical protein [Clostridia bacterium]
MQNHSFFVQETGKTKKIIEIIGKMTCFFTTQSCLDFTNRRSGSYGNLFWFWAPDGIVFREKYHANGAALIKGSAV